MWGGGHIGKGTYGMGGRSKRASAYDGGWGEGQFFATMVRTY